MRILLALALAHSITTGADARSANPILKRILSGNGLGARANLVGLLAQKPDDPETNVLMGMALTAEGRHNDSLIYYRSGNSDKLYWTQGVLFHANSLRSAGHGTEAAELRAMNLMAKGQDDHSSIWMAIAEDYRQAGDLDAAWEAGMMSLSERPAGKRHHTLLAEIAMDAGQIELARDHILLADHRIGGLDPASLYLAKARLLIAEGDAEGALKEIEQSRAQQRWQPAAIYLQTIALLSVGEVLTAEAVLNRNKLYPNQSPYVLLARIHLLIAKGQDKEAKRAWAELQDLAPGTPMFPEYVPGLSPDPQSPK